MDNRLLGLAKKAGLLEIGDDCVARAARKGRVRAVLSASDASEASKRRARMYAERCGAVHIALPSTRLELGAVLGRGAPGILAVLDAGIAAKYASMLACLDPGRYGEAAARLAEQAEHKRRRRKEENSRLRGKRTGMRRTTDEHNV